MYKQKINTDFAISIIVILAVFFAGIFWLIGMRSERQDPQFIGPPVGSQPSDPNSIPCIEDAMLCPDGVTYVGRIGPKCEFAACPKTGKVNPSYPGTCNCISGQDCPCARKKLPERRGGLCVDKCGDGVCQEVVCMGSGCPCSETAISSESNYCPQDCKGNDPQPMRAL